jgi:D-3-phosphoglycerate dehydrogenase
LDAKRLALAKPGVRIINCARGGLIDEAALAEALKSGRVAGAALDVYEAEPPPADNPLRGLPNVVMTPHLGASTAEAQEMVGIEVAIQVRDVLLRGEIRNAVNVPSIDARTLAQLGPFLNLGARLGRFLSQIAPKRCETLTVSYSGTINEMETGPITRAVLRGFLATAGGAEVNEVNAPSLAASLGLEVSERRLATQGDFTEQIDVTATSDGVTVSVSGTCFAQTPRLVRINDRPVEAKPEGILLLLENRDVPGMVGAVGTLLGKHRVNIAGMSLSRNQVGGLALTILNLDTAPGDNVIGELLSVENIVTARVIKL